MNKNNVKPTSALVTYAPLAALVALLSTLEGCAVAEGIFKTGFGVGVAVAVVILGIIGGVLALGRK
jgi:hypothetical protein